MRIDHRLVKPKIRHYAISPEDLQSSVTAVRTQKYLSTGAGVFTILLIPKPRRNANLARASELVPRWYNSISPMDIVEIGLPRGVMLGIVDDVFRTRVTTRSGARYGLNISGRDFGKLFLEDNIVFHPGIASIKDAADKLRDSGLSKIFMGLYKIIDQDGKKTIVWQNKRPSEAIHILLRQFPSLKAIVQISETEAVEYHDLIEEDLITRDSDRIAAGEAIATAQGSLWNIMNACIDKDFYELFVDTRPPGAGESISKAVLRLRPKPYDRKGEKVYHQDVESEGHLLSYRNGRLSEGKADILWDNIKNLVDGEPCHVKNNSDILEFRSGVSDREAVSIVNCTANFDLTSESIGRLSLDWPYIDVSALKRYGLREYNAATKYLTRLDLQEEIEKGEGGDLLKARLFPFRDRIFNWYRRNPAFECGQATMKGDESVRVGDKIFFKDEISKSGSRGIIAYVVSVVQSWTFGKPFTTIVQFVRGENARSLEEFADTRKDEPIRIEL